MALSVEEELVAAENLEAAGTVVRWEEHTVAPTARVPLGAALGAAWVAAMGMAVAEVE